MKCQHCDKQAVFHITELESGAVRELHLCEDHARTYLNQSEVPAEGPSLEEGEEAAAGGGGLTGPLGVGQTADELALLDQRSCDMCGITFFEFRNQGRLGCPHDYVQFEKELEPLIANIHGATEHTGRRPSRESTGRGEPLPEGTQDLTGVIGLRREMKEAISLEDYEKARENRDAIRSIEDRWLPAPGSGGIIEPPADSTGEAESKGAE
jgi:protein arginine kinase activator